MDWTKEANARLLATAYIVGFVAWLIGVLCILYNQFTAGAVAGMIVGAILFVIGQVLICVVAFTLRSNFQTSASTSSFSQAWQRLSVGLELPPAVRVLRTR
jgi:hypothetical protein